MAKIIKLILSEKSAKGLVNTELELGFITKEEYDKRVKELMESSGEVLFG